MLSLMEDQKGFKRVTAWKKSMLLCREVYELCLLFPANEIYSLSNQMKRSSVSIPSNIAEGYRRKSSKEYTHFLSIAIGSAAELETQLLIANDVFSVNVDDQLRLVTEIQKLLYVMIRNQK